MINCPNCNYLIVDHESNSKIVITSLTQTCGGCPSQWDAETVDGKYVYIRYRWGTLNIEVDHQNIFSLNHGDGLDGILAEDKLKLLTNHLIYWQV